jgi:hypothetical protein
VPLSSHSAASSALGYLYQTQWPLLELLRRSEERPDHAVSLELHDDVAWEDDGTPVELLQLKHHLRERGGLGDRDADVWRTLRAWMDTVDVGDPNGPALTLVTTQTAAEGSAAEALRPPHPDPIRALSLLETAAQESIARDSEGSRRQFLELDATRRAIFVSRIRVLDASPAIGDLDAQVRGALRWALPRGHEDTFVQLLWGWWHTVAVDLLRRRRRSVSADELAIQVDRLRDQFTRDNLPTLVGAEAFDPAEQASYLDRHFVHQLCWVNTPSTLIQKAIIDYYRAYTQTARWIDDHLVGLDELASFESRLHDEWEREFAWMLLELTEDSDEHAQRQAGLRLLRKTLDNTAVRVRDRYDEPFYCRGKHHELADTGQVGWHPDFTERLATLLVGAQA